MKYIFLLKVSVIDSTSECKWILTYLSESAKCSAQLISITELWRNSDWRRPSWDAEHKALRGHISRFFLGQTNGITSYNHSSYTALNICSHNTTPSFLSRTGEGYSDLELSSHSLPNLPGILSHFDVMVLPPICRCCCCCCFHRNWVWGHDRKVKSMDTLNLSVSINKGMTFLSQELAQNSLRGIPFIYVTPDLFCFWWWGVFLKKHVSLHFT